VFSNLGRPGQQYCSFPCWAEHGDPASHFGGLKGVGPADPVRGGYGDRDCLRCGERFEARMPRQVYCGRGCWKQSHRPRGCEQVVTKTPTTLTCTGCNRQFGRLIYHTSSATGSPYCSAACFAANRPRKRSYKKERGIGKPVPGLAESLACLVCQGSFQPYHLKQVCCGVVCLARHEAAKIREQVERVQRERCK
jgi:hypothetical protein